MAEPLNLAPVRVHAVSVPVRRPPDSIAGPDEMMLQLGENGGVQVDVFGRDAQGNELHESREMQEDEYEEMRARYMRAEQATMPPFNSFKSGNTIGRVVGETAPAAVPASQANPPLEAETEEEGITGEQILDGIQLGLDVVGLIPVVGEVADIASGIISLFRGDYVGAGLSLLSAIPFVGYAGTAGKVARYGTKMTAASGNAGKEVAKGAGKKTNDGAKIFKPKKLKPGTPQHKADRWIKYQERGGKKDYDSWSKQYDTNMRNYQYGLAREKTYRDAMGASEGTLKTPATNRQIDILKEKDLYAGQLKTGRVSLTRENQLAIQKDALLVKDGWKVEHILEKGATKPYLNSLDKAGIHYKIGPQITH
ncbi:hypothetical protein [Pseudomonas triticicola]|uniref:hypothetical protein n=1 Tax=Pseudomonas triticicola TaxID=2842345 RepID=UPI003EB6C275